MLTPAGTPPPARYRHSAVHDPAHDRMLVFGGDSHGPLRNDVWALSLAGATEWSELIPSGPPPGPRSAHCAIYDPPRERMVVFGGSGATALLDDVWALSLSGTPAWTELAPRGSSPGPPYTGNATLEPPRGAAGGG